jgi:hypothetical protein
MSKSTERLATVNPIPVPADENSRLVEKGVLRLQGEYGGWVAYGLQMALSCAFWHKQLLFASSVFNGQQLMLSMETTVQQMEIFLKKILAKVIKLRKEAACRYTSAHVARVSAAPGLVKHRAQMRVRDLVVECEQNKCEMEHETAELKESLTKLNEDQLKSFVAQGDPTDTGDVDPARQAVLERLRALSPPDRARLMALPRAAIIRAIVDLVRKARGLDPVGHRARPKSGFYGVSANFNLRRVYLCYEKAALPQHIQHKRGSSRRV